MTDAYAFTLNGTPCLALPSGALFVPSEDLLVVSDLHLGKSERAARRHGVMLPPYETRATLDRLARDIVDARPACVVALGDSFDDLAAAAAIEPEDRDRILALQDGRRWVWIEGNHDPAATLHGEAQATHHAATLTFRHIAEPSAAPGEVSGHYHPKHGLPGWSDRRACFATDGVRLVMPAYGTYTGGLDACAPVIRTLLAPRAIAILTGRRAMAVPLPQGLRRRA